MTNLSPLGCNEAVSTLFQSAHFRLVLDRKAFFRLLQKPSEIGAFILHNLGLKHVFAYIRFCIFGAFSYENE